MPNEQRKTKTKTKRWRALLLAASALLIAGFAILQIPWSGWFGERLTIGPDTTVQEGPLRPDGGIDYIAVVNQQLSAGVTAENNAVVELLRVFQPGKYDDQELRMFYELLKVEPVVQEHTLDDPWEYVWKKREAALSAESGQIDSEVLHEQVAKEAHVVYYAPWQSGDFPDWAEALDQTNPALDVLVSASNKPRYYHPVVAIAEEEGDATYCGYGHTFSVNSDLRFALHQLKLRALNHLGKGETVEAIEDVKSIRRLAALMLQSLDINEAVLAGSVFDIACQSESILFASNALSRKQLDDYRQFLGNYPFVDDWPRRIDNSERYRLLDWLQMTAIRGYEGHFKGSVFSGGWAWSWPMKAIVGAADQAESMREVNQWMDRYVDALNRNSLRGKSEALKELDRDLGQMRDRVSSGWSVAGQLFSGPAARGKFWGQHNVAALLWRPHFFWKSFAQERTIKQDLIALACNAALYRMDHGAWPESLEELVPDYIDQLPLDTLNDRPFSCRVADGTFLVYSFGPDGIDNNGLTRHETTVGEYDVRIRIGDRPQPEAGSRIDNERRARESELRRQASRRQKAEEANSKLERGTEQ